MCYTRGNAYLQMKETIKAKNCFKEALTVDVKCYDVSMGKEDYPRLYSIISG